MYSGNQLSVVSDYLKSKFLSGEIESLELVTTLMAMNRAGKIDEDGVAKILTDVYMGSTEGALRALRKASQIISDKDIEEILEKLSKNTPSDNK